MIPVPVAVVLIALVAVAVAVVIRRIRQADTRDLAAYQRRVRTVDQVMDDVHRWKADRRMRETREALATCEAIYALPTTIPQQRKELP